MKTCNSCKKELAPELFSRRAASKDGLAAKCKLCSAEYLAVYYQNNSRTIKARTADWKIANPEKIQAGKIRYRAKHREIINEKNAAWYAENRDVERARCAAYHARNPDVAAERGRRWAELNPEARRAAWLNRRARVSQAVGSHTGEDIALIYRRQRGMCVACRCKLGDKYHVDHVTALAKGGSNGPENLQLLCPKCNRRKSAKHPTDFMRESGYLI